MSRKNSKLAKLSEVIRLYSTFCLRILFSIYSKSIHKYLENFKKFSLGIDERNLDNTYMVRSRIVLPQIKSIYFDVKWSGVEF